MIFLNGESELLEEMKPARGVCSVGAIVGAAWPLVASADPGDANQPAPPTNREGLQANHLQPFDFIGRRIRTIRGTYFDIQNADLHCPAFAQCQTRSGSNIAGFGTTGGGVSMAHPSSVRVTAAFRTMSSHFVSLSRLRLRLISGRLVGGLLLVCPCCANLADNFASKGKSGG